MKHRIAQCVQFPMQCGFIKGLEQKAARVQPPCARHVVGKGGQKDDVDARVERGQLGGERQPVRLSEPDVKERNVHERVIRPFERRVRRACAVDLRIRQHACDRVHRSLEDDRFVVHDQNRRTSVRRRNRGEQLRRLHAQTLRQAWEHVDIGQPFAGFPARDRRL